MVIDDERKADAGKNKPHFAARDHVDAEREPFTSVQGLWNIQPLMRFRSPKVGEVKVEEMIDNRVKRTLDESNFIERAFATQSAKL